MGSNSAVSSKGREPLLGAIWRAVRFVTFRWPWGVCMCQPRVVDQVRVNSAVLQRPRVETVKRFNGEQPMRRDGKVRVGWGHECFSLLVWQIGLRVLAPC